MLQKIDQNTIVRVAVGLAMILPLPALVLPFWRDDFVHQLAIKAWLGEDVPNAYLIRRSVDAFGFVNLFHFIRSTQVDEMIARGDMPWWVPTDTHVSFWRPLSSFTHVVDYLVFGSQPAFHRMQSMLWYGALVIAVAWLYRRHLSAALFPLALLLFVVEEAHWGPTCFIANRNALVTGVLGVFALLTHIHRRQMGSGWGGLRSLLLFALALLGGEAALGAFAYLVAYELLTEQRTAKQRIAALLPPALLGLVWAAFYKLGDHGARGTDFYIDPTQAPLRFLAAAIERYLVLMCSQLAGVIAELSLASPELKYAQMALGLFAVLLVAWLLRRLWPDMDPKDRRALRWLIPGAILSSLPLLATYPMDRLLLLPSIGGAAVVAVVIRQVWGQLRAWKAISWPQRLLPVALSPMLLTHIAIPIVVWLGLPTVMNGYHDRLHKQLSPEVFEREDLDQCSVFVFGAPDLLELWFLPARRILSGTKIPAVWRVLSASILPQRLHRTGERSLELESLEGKLLPWSLLHLIPPPHQRYAVGDTVQLNGLQIRIMEADVHRLKRIAFAFDTSLDDDRTILLIWGANGLERLRPPALGQSVELYQGAEAATGEDNL